MLVTLDDGHGRGSLVLAEVGLGLLPIDLDQLTARPRKIGGIRGHLLALLLDLIRRRNPNAHSFGTAREHTESEQTEDRELTHWKDPFLCGRLQCYDTRITRAQRRELKTPGVYQSRAAAIKKLRTMAATSLTVQMTPKASPTTAAPQLPRTKDRTEITTMNTKNRIPQNLSMMVFLLFRGDVSPIGPNRGIEPYSL